MQLLTLTDTKLADLRERVETELGRRAKVATSDAATIIHGNEIGKRAVTVAAAGNHSLLLVGPPNSGKTMLRGLALALGLRATFEARPCPCGYYSVRTAPCRCSSRSVEAHWRKWPVADITVEVVPPSDVERRSAGTTLAEIKAVLAQAKNYISLALDRECENLLRAATRELPAFNYATAQAVARTIADLDQCENIQPQHLNEAIHYQLFRLHVLKG